ncbi:MAG: YceD family protein [Azovibrio sp.]|uniref:YceD family protein n=1 Tax=Azovibrio sp. TaxID=1872673 RepID=UPI003C72A197
MSQQLEIDAYRFVRESRLLEGFLDLSELPRLHDLVTKVLGKVEYRLQGVLGERGQPRLRLEVSGVLPLVCQRCLGAVDEALAIDCLLELIAADSEPTQDELENDSLDFLPVAGALDVKALIEDEILLALPVAPRHAACGLPVDADAGEQLHPFAALAALKTKLN